MLEGLARRAREVHGETGAVWAAAQAVLSAWWTVEDHGTGWEPSLACAELLLGLLR